MMMEAKNKPINFERLLLYVKGQVPFNRKIESSLTADEIMELVT